MDEPPDLYLEDDDFILSRLNQYAPPSLPAVEGFGVPAEVYEDVPRSPGDDER